jgi:hypothetical protein
MAKEQIGCIESGAAKLDTDSDARTSLLFPIVIEGKSAIIREL